MALCLVQYISSCILSVSFCLVRCCLIISCLIYSSAAVFSTDTLVAGLLANLICPLVSVGDSGHQRYHTEESNLERGSQLVLFLLRAPFFCVFCVYGRTKHSSLLTVVSLTYYSCVPFPYLSLVPLPLHLAPYRVTYFLP